MGTRAGEMNMGAGPVSDSAVEELFRISDALNTDCQFEAADRTVVEAMRGRTGDVRLVQHYARLALQRGDWREAVQRAEVLRRTYPNNPAGYRCGIEAESQLRHIGKAMELQRESVQRFPDKSWPHVHAAMLAELSQNFDMAESRWELVCKRFPEESSGWREWIVSRMHAGRLEAAETLLAEALRRFPNDARIHGLWPLIVTRSGRHEEVEERWRLLVERFPDDPQIALGHAEAPVAIPRDKRWDHARSLLEELHRKFPDFAMGYLRHVQLLVRMGEIDSAAELATTARNLLRNSDRNADITIELTRILELKGDVEGARRLLETLLNESPNSVSAYVALANLLTRLSQFDEAEAVCKRAIARFKFRAPPLIEYAKIATSKGDLEAALQRWKRAYYLVPRDPTVDGELFIARLAITDEQSQDSGSDALLEVGRTQRSGPLTSLMMQFESLGAPGGGGCEVGLVQRKFGAEPIGLLRWGALELEDLIMALRERFEGLGSREQTQLTLPGIEFGQTEYNVQDKRFRIGMHTWVMRDEVDAEKLLDQWCVRLQFLRRKLISDLESAAKIFVYKPGSALTPSQIDQLGAAMRSYGDNELLLVRRQEPESCNGTVRRIAPGIMMGYIDRVNWEDPERPARQPSFASWARICANAHALAVESKS